MCIMSLKLPSGDVVYDGGIVKLGEDSTNYFVHYGLYKYDKTECVGWYLQAVGSSTCVPISDVLLGNARVMNSGGAVTLDNNTCGCNCNISTNIDSNQTLKFTKYDKYTLDRSLISVNTIAERDALPISLVSAGRIVRVLSKDAHDSDCYTDYKYNLSTLSWDEVDYRQSKIYQELISSQDILKHRIEELEKTVDSLQNELEALKNATSNQIINS